MSRKIMLKVNAAAIKARMKESEFNYGDIEEASAGKITVISLKHFLNKGTKVDEETLDILADLLDCSKNHLLDDECVLSMNLPAEINSLVEGLYMKNREDINRYYAEHIKVFRNNANLKAMLDQTHRLFHVMLESDFIFDKGPFVEAFNIIATDFVKSKAICNEMIVGLLTDKTSALYDRILAVSGDYSTQQVILMFLYVLILFDAIFLTEEIASAAQLVPERKTAKADQFFELALRTEKMRNALINHILYVGFDFDDPSISEHGVDDDVLEAVALMLAVCEKCHRHINGEFVNSEYINRATFSAILRRLEKTFETLEIDLPKADDAFTESIKMNTTHFAVQYNGIKTAFGLLNPPRKPSIKEKTVYVPVPFPWQVGQ